VNKPISGCDDQDFSLLCVVGLGAVNGWSADSVDSYRYLSRRDEVVGVQVVGSPGRLRTITMTRVLGR
jgi:hypothetical protein